MFDQDKKQIYFIYLKKYENDSNNENVDEKENDGGKNSGGKDNKIYIYLSIVVIFIALAAVIGFIFGRKIWEKHRKKRACELDDNYDYTKKNDNENDSAIIN